jgi:two-component system sensor histidine kinase EvgS
VRRPSFPSVRAARGHLLWRVARMLPLIALLFALARTSGAGEAPTAQGDKLPPVLKVGVLASGWPPFEQFEDGHLRGLSVDYLQALVGSAVTLEPKLYPDMPHLLAATASGEVDVMMSIARTPERQHYLSFTAPYFRSSTAVVVNARQGQIRDIAQLADARVAVELGFAQEHFLRERFPRARIVTFADTASALRALQRGDADAYLGFTPAVRHALAHRAYPGLHIAFESSALSSELRFALARDHTALRNRLDRALAAMPPAEQAEIVTHWLGPGADSPPPPVSQGLLLTADERAWLAALPPLTVGFDAGWPPFSYVDGVGRMSGIAADYLDYIAATLGVHFVRAHTGDWPATIHAFEHGDVAMLATSSPGDPRLRGAWFSRPYESYPLVIVGREDEPAVRGLVDFSTRRVALPAQAAGSISLAGYHIPDANVTVVPNLPDALALLADGKVDAVVGNVAAIDVELKEAYHGTLKILGTVGEADSLGFAVRPDLAQLAGLIDRALLAMPPAQKERIREKWVRGVADSSVVWSVTAVRLLPLLIGIAVVLVVTLRAYTLLQREMRLRKNTERALEAQLNFQQSMMESVPYPLAAKDIDGRYIAVNRAYEQACGLRREQVIGRTGREVGAWGEQNGVELERVMQEIFARGEPVQTELLFADPSGKNRHGLFLTSLCRGVDGEPSYLIGTMVDITDIRRAEMLARENERRLFDVTRSLPVIVFQLRRDPQGGYSFPYLGGDLRHLLGDRAYQAHTRPQVDFGLVWPEDRPRLFAALERSARRGTPVHIAFRSHAADGVKWGRAELAPREEDDGGVLWSGYWVDASAERARADELARARDLAEAASRAKDDFLAMMSHEIRTPMNGVLGLVEVLERTRLNDDQNEMLGMIHESAGALLQILDDLLDYSKIEAGRLTIESEPLDLRELVDNAVGLLAGRAHEKGLKVRVDVTADIAASLRGDSVRLRQILFNLLGNAIKFTPAGQVDVRVAVLDDVRDTQTIEMTVEDTGIGIAPEVQAHLFEPFAQAESSTTRRFGGTGLGLTICRKLVALMGGRLELQSTPNVGTRMIVRLAMPVAQRDDKASALRGRRGVVVYEDGRIAQALVHFGAALGIALRALPPGDPALRDPAVMGDVDLIFTGDGMEVPTARVDGRGAPRVIRLTEKSKPTGYRIADDAVRVSVNPVSWRGLGAACAAALTGLSNAPARARVEAEAPAGAPDRERAIASGRLILVAEDHPVNQELIRHQLALLGFACDVVNHGGEALAELERTRYGCLITDCHMPNLSGYELARLIREAEAARGGARRLPILGITANTAPEDLNRCREAGMDDWLVKPTRLATLREHLNRWFGADNARQPDAPVPAPEAREEAGESFVPVDLEYLMRLWGSESTVKALLASFVSSMRDDFDALPSLLEQSDLAALREWHHRVAGAAGVLQYPPLLEALEHYRRGLAVRSPQRCRADGLALMRKGKAILDGIEEQAALLA